MIGWLCTMPARNWSNYISVNTCSNDRKQSQKLDILASLEMHVLEKRTDDS